LNILLWILLYAMEFLICFKIISIKIIKLFCGWYNMVWIININTYYLLTYIINTLFLEKIISTYPYTKCKINDFNSLISILKILSWNILRLIDNLRSELFFIYNDVLLNLNLTPIVVIYSTFNVTISRAIST